MIRIAITCFDDEVAPCFEVTRRFQVWELEDGEISGYQVLETQSANGIERCRLLKQHKIDVLICNGIDRQMQRLLEAEGCQVVSGVSGKLADALYGYSAGRIGLEEDREMVSSTEMSIHTADLVEWTRELFEKLGWSVNIAHHPDTFPIDLTAMRKCPVCGHEVRIAICCGAHAYRVEEEILEFKRVSTGGYHARVYVQHILPGIVETCRDFEIELLEPETFANWINSKGKQGDIPPLRGKVSGHERLNQGV